RADIALADALFALQGLTTNRVATAIYSQIVKDFIVQQGPLENYPSFAGAAARWAAIKTGDNYCRYNDQPLRDAEWDATWTQLGVSPAHNPCWLRKNSFTRDEMTKLGPLHRVTWWVNAFYKCLEKGGYAESIFRTPKDPIEIGYCFQMT